MKFLAPGIVIFAQAFLTLFTGLLIATDRGSSFLTRLYVSKAKSHEFILSYALSVLPKAIKNNDVTKLNKIEYTIPTPKSDGSMIPPTRKNKMD